MTINSEKSELKGNEPQGLDVDGLVEHPGVSTVRDEETKTAETDSDSIHSHNDSSIGSISPSPNQLDPPHGSISKTLSVTSKPLTIVPRVKRRGLLARFAIVPEVENPYEYKRSTKWFITFTVAVAAAAAPMGSAILLRKSIFVYASLFLPVEKLIEC